ncbi:MAG TPA: hypothetical protein VLC98_14050 [Phnomibacter sp.]|nr:hypothetical protein [Phnomibacter sp.]
MRSILYRISWLFVFALVAFNINAQNIDSLLSIQRSANPQQKLYLHFDKEFYNPGETIWFKAYIFNGIDRDTEAKNFYAELVDDSGRVIERKTAPVFASGAASHFELSANLQKSTLYVRAYTQTMLNGDSSFLYVQPLRIVLPPKKSTGKTIAPTELSFLPEGGNWVAGLSGVLGFKAVNSSTGLPVYVTGIIKNKEGQKVADFASIHNGMGAITFTPVAGQQYTAVWKDENKKEYNTPLPSVTPSGLTLTIQNTESGKQFTIKRTEDAPESFKRLTVAAFIGQQLVYQAKVNLSQKTTVSALLPTQDLPSGIVQISVLSSDLQPLAERICFVNNNSFEFDADAWFTQTNTSKRGLNAGEIKISDTVMSNMSLAISDADLNTGSNYRDNIISHMLLTGDLRGKIENPYYYFFSTSDSVAYHLDLVMLTHGWRRYNWNAIASGKAVMGKPEKNYLSLDGQIIKSQQGNFPPNLALSGFMTTPDSASNFLNLPVDRTGKVHSDGYVFYGTAKLYMSLSDKLMVFDASSLNATNGLLPAINNQLTPEMKQGLFEPDSITVAENIKNNTTALKAAAKQYADAHVLQNVTVTARAKNPAQKMDEQYASGMFSGGDAQQFDVAGDPLSSASFSVFQYLQGKVAGLQITTGGTEPQMSWRGGTPTLYLNEMRTDASQISTLNMADVAYIKVFSPSATGAIQSSGGGAISVYTKKGADTRNTDPSSNKRMAHANLMGYSANKEFYSPDYATATGSEFYDDQRSTLFWDPFIILDKQKKRYKFQFYNNDFTKTFRLVVEGIDDNGKLIHIEKIISKP